MNRLSAQDVLDGDLDDWDHPDGYGRQLSRAGSYTMSVEEVSNSFGDTSTADLPVHVVSADNQQVQIGLTTGIVYASAGEQLSIPQIMSRV